MANKPEIARRLRVVAQQIENGWFKVTAADFDMVVVETLPTDAIAGVIGFVQELINKKGAAIVADLRRVADEMCL